MVGAGAFLRWASFGSGIRKKRHPFNGAFSRRGQTAACRYNDPGNGRPAHQLSDTLNQPERLKVQEGERKRKIWFEQIEWSRPSLGTREASRLRNDVGFAKRKWPFKNALKIYMLSITVFKYFLILVTLKVG